MDTLSVVLVLVAAAALFTGLGITLRTNKNLRAKLQQTIRDYADTLAREGAKLVDMQEELEEVGKRLSELEATCEKLNPLLTAIRLLHEGVFAAYGLNVGPLFNAVWKIVELEEKGAPRINADGRTK